MQIIFSESVKITKNNFSDIWSLKAREKRTLMLLMTYIHILYNGDAQRCRLFIKLIRIFLSKILFNIIEKKKFSSEKLVLNDLIIIPGRVMYIYN